MQLTITWKSGSVTSIVYMIQYGGFNIIVDTYEVLLLLVEWDTYYFMDPPSKFHMR